MEKKARKKRSDGVAGAHFTRKRESVYVDLSDCEPAANLWHTSELRPICQGDFIINTVAWDTALNVPLSVFPVV